MMHYTRLSDADRRAALEQRATNLETEHWQATISLKTLVAATGPEPSESDAAEIARLESVLDMLDAAHAVVGTEIAKIEDPHAEL